MRIKSLFVQYSELFVSTPEANFQFHTLVKRIYIQDTDSQKISQNFARMIDFSACTWSETAFSTGSTVFLIGISLKMCIQQL